MIAENVIDTIYAERHVTIGGDKMNHKERIKIMSDDDLWELFVEIYRAGESDAISYEWGIRQNTFIWDDKWLNQEEDKWEGLMYAT